MTKSYELKKALRESSSEEQDPAVEKLVAGPAPAQRRAPYGGRGYRL